MAACAGVPDAIPPVRHPLSPCGQVYRTGPRPASPVLYPWRCTCGAVPAPHRPPCCRPV